MTRVRTSVSTWQPGPVPAPSAARLGVLDTVAHAVVARGPGRLRVAVDGRTAAGKSTFGHQLAERLAALGRPALRASLDDFKRPWAERHLLDRQSGEGYYRNAFDLDAVRALLLDPAAPGGTGRVVLCLRDPRTQETHDDRVVEAEADAVLVVDGVFALRPELDDCWDLRIWLEVSAAVALERGVARDGGRSEGAASTRRAVTDDGTDPLGATVVHRDRYAVAEEVYLREVDAVGRADVVVDVGDHAAPRLLRS